MVQVSSRLTTTLIVCILILLEAAAGSLSVADQIAAILLKQARDEKIRPNGSNFWIRP